MDYKRLVILIVLIGVASLLFFFSSWTNAMVVSGETLPSEIAAMSKISPMLTGLLAVISVGFLILIVFYK